MPTPSSIEHPRTKEILAKDLSIVLNTPVTMETKNAVIKNIASAWTQYDGKYEGCRFWTEDALVEYEANGRQFLVHEQATPIKVVRKLLGDFKAPTERDVFQLFNRVVIGTVVTCEEERVLFQKFRSTMPDTFFDRQHEDFLNPWSRYRECSIQLVDTLQL